MLPIRAALRLAPALLFKVEGTSRTSACGIRAFVSRKIGARRLVEPHTKQCDPVIGERNGTSLIALVAVETTGRDPLAVDARAFLNAGNSGDTIACIRVYRH